MWPCKPPSPPPRTINWLEMTPNYSWLMFRQPRCSRSGSNGAFMAPLRHHSITGRHPKRLTQAETRPKIMRAAGKWTQIHVWDEASLQLFRRRAAEEQGRPWCFSPLFKLMVMTAITGGRLSWKGNAALFVGHGGGGERVGSIGSFSLRIMQMRWSLASQMFILANGLNLQTQSKLPRSANPPRHRPLISELGSIMESVRIFAAGN